MTKTRFINSTRFGLPILLALAFPLAAVAEPKTSLKPAQTLQEFKVQSEVI
jgi:hypothetical protein